MPGSPSDPPAVLVRGVGKEFRSPVERVHTLKERALHPFRQSGHEEFTALNDVSFAVQPGEFFGIVGRNGSGKSTLLKCLAGIYGVDRGQIYVRGRLSTFIELGVGFNPDLAARDNVILNGIMLGLTPREARRRVDEVIAFAELEEFAELKLKNYSSGMHVRLAFSVMIQVDADVLLIDEVLAVGDASFQQKCFDVFHRLRDEGKTILFVTHDMAAVKRFCDRAMLIEHGDVKLIGEPDRVGNHYMELNFGRDRTADGKAAEAGDEVIERFGSGGAQIVDGWLEDAEGNRTAHLQQGHDFRVCVRVRYETAVDEPIPALLIENEQHAALFATSTWDHDVPTGPHQPGDEAVMSVTMRCSFGPGRIYLSPWIVSEGTLLDRRPRFLSAVITALHDTGALMDLPHQISYERDDGRTPVSPAPRVGPS